MVFFENVWWLLVLIGVMIIIHELGHYWAARFFDVCIETFSFGFGPRLFGFRKGETDFRFSLILFGGYVKMLDEREGPVDPADAAETFNRQLEKCIEECPEQWFWVHRRWRVPKELQP